ncbi:MAG: radical SAM protein [Deltaproteobacteria bacterium]|nr:radical SAM protein [Deltaproteobacteria bacterium]
MRAGVVQTFAVEGGGLFVRESGRIWLRANERWMELDGALADELAAVLDGDEPGPRLAALARTGLDGADLLLETARKPRREVARDGLLVERPTILFLELTDRCSLHCRHCYAEAAEGPGVELEPALARDVIGQAAELGFGRLQLTGGEPLLHERVAELAGAAASAGISRVEVFTSGVSLSPEQLADFPTETRFALSVYSTDAAVHDAVTGVPGSLEATLAAVDRILERGAGLRVAVIMMAANAEGWEHTRGALVARGVPERSIHASMVTRVGRGQAVEPPAELPDLEDADAADPEPADDPTVWPGKAAIAPNGDVFPCIFARWLKLGNVHQRPLGEILARPELPAVAGLPVRERWSYCAERLSCPDCRVLAFGLMGSGR